MEESCKGGGFFIQPSDPPLSSVPPLRLALLLCCIAAFGFPEEGRAASVSAAAGVTLRTELQDRSLTVPMALSYQQVVLEQRQGSGWKPLSVQYPRSLSREQMRNISFALPQDGKPEDFRVQGYRMSKFPARFLHGKHQYSRAEAPPAGRERQAMDRLRKTPKVSLNSVSSSKPDLWLFHDTRLYYFHQQRGLQVVDLADPAHPHRSGGLRIPALGEQLHVLDDAGTQLILLGKATSKDRFGLSTLFSLTVTEEGPSLTALVPLEGRLVTTRLVGSQLYVLSVLQGNGQPQRTQLIRVDLQSPESPKLLGKSTFTGLDPAFQTKDGRLFVEVTQAGNRRLHEVLSNGASGSAAELLTRQNAEVLIAGYRVTVKDQELRVEHTERTAEVPVIMPLAWRTDRVMPMGDFLVQVEEGSVSASARGPEARLRITPASEPDVVVEELLLGEGKVVGLTRREERLFVAQWIASADGRQKLRTWAFDLSDPSSAVELDTVEQVMPGLDAWDVALDAVQPIWVNADSLVWYLPARNYPGGWWGKASQEKPSREKAKDILPLAAPALVLCQVRLTGDALTAGEAKVLLIQGRLTASSRAFAENGMLYCSYDTADEPVPTVSALPMKVQVPLRPSPAQVRSWLQVVDFRSGDPVLREAVSIPGPLLSIAQADSQGAVILTHSHLTLRNDGAALRLAHASAYDGVAAYHLDTYITATSFHAPSATDGTRLYFTRQTGQTGVVSVGYHASTGRLSQVSSWNTQASPEVLHVAAGHLLASSHGNLELAAIGQESGNLTPIASYDTPAPLCLRVDRAMATPVNDLWIPAGLYGVEFLQKQAPSSP